MYVKRLPLVLGIGLLALPISVIVTVADSLLLRTSSVFGVETEGGPAASSCSWSSRSAPR
jgi:hypothetical protein